MSRFASFAALFFALVVPGLAQPVTLDLVGTVEFPATAAGNGTSDVWGYVAPDGSEYAIVGVLGGTAIVSVPDLEVLHTIPGPTGGDFYYHRDMVVYGSALYVVAEMTGTNEGIQVIDLSGLPETATLVSAITAPGNVRSHNMDVDPVTGYAYVLSQNASSVRIFDLAEPLAPVEIGLVDVPSVHDVHARGDTLWVAEGSSPSTFSVWDVTDKQNPALMARQLVPSAGYVHNIWPSSDGQYAVTTEETQNRTVKVWDTSDMDDINLVGEYLGNNGLAHNAHVMGDLVVLSHYGAGVTVMDISDPSSPVEAAAYDTTPNSDAGGFFGTWGAWPYSPSGYVYASDFDGVLTVLQLDRSLVANEDAAPTGVRFAEVYPNPTRSGATLQFALPEAGAARAALYDVLGREVAVVAEGTFAAGEHTVTLDSARLPAGTYFLRVEAGEAVQTLRLARLD